MGSKIVQLTIFAALAASSVQLGAEKLKYEMFEMGYDFHSRYRLQLPASAKFSPKSIEVNVSCGPCSSSRAPESPPAKPFMAGLRGCGKRKEDSFGLNASPFGTTKIRLKSSSPLYLGCKKLLNRIIKKYNTTPGGVQNFYSKPLPLSRESRKIGIKALPRTALESQYYVKVLSEPPGTFSRARIQVLTLSEVQKRHKEKVVTSMVLIECIPSAFAKNPEFSIIKFVLTKKGLKALSKNNIDRTFPWYKNVSPESPWAEDIDYSLERKVDCTSPWYKICKEAAKKGIRKYDELNAKHYEKKSTSENRKNIAQN